MLITSYKLISHVMLFLNHSRRFLTLLVCSARKLVLFSLRSNMICLIMNSSKNNDLSVPSHLTEPLDIKAWNAAAKALGKYEEGNVKVHKRLVMIEAIPVTIGKIVVENKEYTISFLGEECALVAPELVKATEEDFGNNVVNSRQYEMNMLTSIRK